MSIHGNGQPLFEEFLVTGIHKVSVLQYDIFVTFVSSPQICSHLILSSIISRQSQGYFGFSQVTLPPPHGFSSGRDNSKIIYLRPFKFGVGVHMGDGSKPIVRWPWPSRNGPKMQKHKIVSISLTNRDRAISSKFSTHRVSKQYTLSN